MSSERGVDSPLIYGVSRRWQNVYPFWMLNIIKVLICFWRGRSLNGLPHEAAGAEDEDEDKARRWVKVREKRK